MHIELGRLPLGKWRPLTAAEIAGLTRDSRTLRLPARGKPAGPGRSTGP
jgi:hypothetical protein